MYRKGARCASIEARRLQFGRNAGTIHGMLIEPRAPSNPETVPARASGLRWARAGVLLLVIVLFGFVLLFVLKPWVGDAFGMAANLRKMRIGWIIGALVCQGAMYAAVGGVLQSGLDAAAPDTPRLPPLPLVGTAAAFLWTNRALPGPAVAGLATLMFLLGRRGISPGAAQAAAATFYLSDYISFTGLSVVLLLTLALGGRLGGLHPAVLGFAMALVLASLFATVLLLRSPVLVSRVAEQAVGSLARVLRRTDGADLVRRVRGLIDGFYDRWQTISAHPTALGSACAWSLLMHGFEIATVFCAVRAFLPSAAAGALAVAAGTGYVAGNLAAIVSFLPAGIGFFEGAMGASLHFIGGIPVGPAALATVLYRLLSVWLPLPFVLGTARHAVAAGAKAVREPVVR